MGDSEEKYMVVIAGSGSVGKSCLTIRFLQNRFIEDYDPTVEESYKKMLIIDEKPVVLEIVDTAGQEEYRSVRDKYFKSGQGFVIVYSITSRNSFNEAKKILLKIKQVKESSTIPIVLVGNKLDLESERLVEREESEQLKKKYNLTFFESSAKTGLNVTESFEQCVRMLREKYRNKPEKQREEITDSSGGCCTLL
ncbi:ras-like protein [Anaeramoeba flamelloides]|uniref:small monomeric GTPase n=1 Tax=Anaeramoeba flamelloides TaxID=1746091 RepID=A0AAV7ZDC1_9EUKA|nr:ras-like protein [Anaeramoeba flamelloides]KAJ6247917.1 ras-like protein [Anaeramoeba flamelloides]